jgi:hypothetical protein
MNGVVESSDAVSSDRRYVREPPYLLEQISYLRTILSFAHCRICSLIDVLIPPLQAGPLHRADDVVIPGVVCWLPPGISYQCYPPAA